jgi:arsenate reductase
VTTTVYGIRSCDACRKALKWLVQNDVEHRYVDIRETELDGALISRWMKTAGWESLINRRSTTWRNIPEPERSQLSGQTACDLILKYPTVMKRPALDLGEKVVVGFDAAVYANLGLT